MYQLILNVFGPIFAKELTEVSRRRKLYLYRLSYGLAVLAALWLLWSSSRWDSNELSIREVAELGRGLFFTVAIVQFLAIPICLPLLLCDAIAAEREAGTLELLFTTHLRDRQIVFGKVASRLSVFGSLLLSGLPIYCILLLFGGVEPMVMVRLLASTLVVTVFVATLSIYYSSVRKTPMGAAISTYLALLLYTIVWPILFSFAVGIMAAVLGDEAMEWLFDNAFSEKLFFGVVIAHFLPINVVLALEPEAYQQAVIHIGPWVFWGGFLLPLLFSALLLWRATVRVRHQPRVNWLVRLLRRKPRSSAAPAVARPEGAVQPGPVTPGEIPVGHMVAGPPVLAPTGALASGASPLEPPPLLTTPLPEAAVVPLVEGAQHAGAAPQGGVAQPAGVSQPRQPVRHPARARTHGLLRESANPLVERARLVSVYDSEGYVMRAWWAGLALLGLVFAMTCLGDWNHREYRTESSFSDEEVGVVTIFFAWTAAGAMTLLMAASSVVGERRRGFLDQVLVTPLDARELVDGTCRAVWLHVRRYFWVCWALTFFFVLTGAITWQAALAITILMMLSGAMLTLIGVACASMSRTLSESLAATVVFGLVMSLSMILVTEAGWKMPWQERFPLALAAMALVLALSWIGYRRKPLAILFALGAGAFCALMLGLAVTWWIANEASRSRDYSAMPCLLYWCFTPVEIWSTRGPMGSRSWLRAEEALQRYTDHRNALFAFLGMMIFCLIMLRYWIITQYDVWVGRKSIALASKAKKRPQSPPQPLPEKPSSKVSA